MKRLKKFVLPTVVGLIVLIMAGCGGTSSSKSSEITVATVIDYPPFESKQDGKLTGFDIDLMEAIAKMENLKVNWKEMKFDGIIPALQAKQIDASISGITIRDDRKQIVDFTEPYYTAGLSLVVKKDSSIQNLEDMKGKTIVGKQGSAPLAKAKELAEKYGANVKILQDETMLYLDVETGNADITIADFPGVAYKIKVDGDKGKLRILGDKLTAEDYGIAVVKGKTEILDKLNHGLQELKKNGEFQKLYDKYFGTN